MNKLIYLSVCLYVTISYSLLSPFSLVLSVARHIKITREISRFIASGRIVRGQNSSSRHDAISKVQSMLMHTYMHNLREIPLIRQAFSKLPRSRSALPACAAYRLCICAAPPFSIYVYIASRTGIAFWFSHVRNLANRLQLESYICPQLELLAS